MKIIQAPMPIPPWDSPRLFLSGSIEMGTAENWQERLQGALSDLDVTILNPRRNDWDASWAQSIENPQFKEQVEWELNALDTADLIVFYFSPSTRSPITLLELGAFGWRGRDAGLDLHTAMVCCPEGFWKKGNVDVFCAWQGIKQAASLDDLITWVRQRVSKLPDPTIA